MKNISKLFVCLLFLAFLFGCASVFYTDRQQTLLIADSELASMSLNSFQEVKNTSKLSTNRVHNERVLRVAKKITNVVDAMIKENPNANLPNFDWEFIVIDDDETINAWCLPGGQIAVYSGIFSIADNDDELAVVLGHEIAHALARHGNERMSQQLMLEMGASALDKALEKNPQQTRNIFNSVYGIGSNLGVLLPYSRLHETEADKIGLVLMAKAQYDPRSAISFWQKLSKLSSAKPPEFLSTHPSDEKRIKDIQKFMPEALKYYKQ